MSESRNHYESENWQSRQAPGGIRPAGVVVAWRQNRQSHEGSRLESLIQ